MIRTQQPDRLWLWWRPALPVAAAAAVYFAFMVRRRSSLVLPVVLLVGQVTAIVVTRPMPASRYTIPVYILGWLTVTLRWFAVRPTVSPPRGVSTA